MKYQRVIHQLDDGRRKYSTHNGKIELWTIHEIENLEINRAKCGDAAFTADFKRYDVSAKELRRRFPKAAIIRVVGTSFEDHNLPLDPTIIF